MDKNIPYMIKNAGLILQVSKQGIILCAGYKKFKPLIKLGVLRPSLVIDGKNLIPAQIRAEKKKNSVCSVSEFNYKNIKLEQEFMPFENSGFRMRSRLCNGSGETFILNSIRMLDTAGNGTLLVKDPSKFLVFEQSQHFGTVRPLLKTQKKIVSAAEMMGVASNAGESSACWLIHNPENRLSFLTGYETAQRWYGNIQTAYEEKKKLFSWSTGFDGGDLLVKAGEKILLEDLLLLCGSNPLDLLEEYAGISARRYPPKILPESPVSFCSWYSFRLSVNEKDILKNALIAKERLRPLGLNIFQLDLGWEKQYLPALYEENAQFPHGLKWLSKKLSGMGFKLGVWKAPYIISEFDPVYRKHPEWIVKDKNGKPLSMGTWYWKPFGKIYILDLTHPRAQKYLAEKMNSLARRGVKYLKADFIGCVMVSSGHNRYNPRIAGVEASRIGEDIINRSLKKNNSDAILLNCGSPEIPGKGSWELTYSCADTGNTGYIGWEHMRKEVLSIACHVFKNRRWGIIQPSCFCVGLPGEIEEARTRASLVFVSGGQVDIGDDLTTLPEDRWQILTSVIPPLSVSARPISLFSPVPIQSLSYEEMNKGAKKQLFNITGSPGANVWHLSLKRKWDKWNLVTLFNFDQPLTDSTGQSRLITCFNLPVKLVGLKPREKYWAYEFWSGQFLGEVPAKPFGNKNYTHSGDVKTLIGSRVPGILDVAFFGPAVKHIILRKIRPHPWVVGTSFHMSGGAEIERLAWDKKRKELSGKIRRCKGEQGFIVIAGAKELPGAIRIAGRAGTARYGAQGSIIVPVTFESEMCSFKIRWK